MICKKSVRQHFPMAQIDRLITLLKNVQHKFLFLTAKLERKRN